jgi:hypothetical protein
LSTGEAIIRPFRIGITSSSQMRESDRIILVQPAIILAEKSASLTVPIGHGAHLDFVLPGFRIGVTRKVRECETTNDLFAFLTTEPNALVGTYHPKAMPVILTTSEEVEIWMEAPAPVGRSSFNAHCRTGP